MKLQKITIAPDNDLTHEIFSVKLPSTDHLNALVMKFTGAYGYGSSGNGDAEYMTAVTRAAISEPPRDPRRQFSLSQAATADSSCWR